MCFFIQSQHPLVIAEQRASVSHTDQGSPWQLFSQDPIQSPFCFFIQGRSRFVQEQPLGLIEQGPGKSQPLLFSDGEHMGPVPFFLEMDCQISDPAQF